MGLYDRDYGRSERTPWDRAQNPRSITITLIVINVVVFFVDMIFPDPQTKQSVLAGWFEVNADDRSAMEMVAIFNLWVHARHQRDFPSVVQHVRTIRFRPRG